MKNCTKHFCQRWAERIVGIETKKEILEYSTRNRDMIVEHANKTFEFAKLIYTGQIGDNITRNYYIEDDLVFVTNTTNDAFITIYRVNLGFTDELNATVRKELIKEVSRLSEQKDEIELSMIEEIEDKELEIDAMSEQILLLKKQVENLEKDRKFKKDEVKHIKSKSLNTNLEIKRYALMLVNSKEYKEDLLNMK